MQNTEALKLPDPLLVRYFREDRIDKIKSVAEDATTRNITVKLRGGAVEKWQHLADLGWIPIVD
jgi:hypothetical protein